MKYNVYRYFTKELVKTGLSEQEVKDFVCGQARELNYGLYRYWEKDGKTYYDCGPITYVIVKNPQ